MRVIGTEVVGVLGRIPIIEVEGAKPVLSNNGDNTYSGQEPGPVDTLGEALYSQTPEHWRDVSKTRCGHVRLEYTEGGSFLAWAGSNDGVVFGFS